MIRRCSFIAMVAVLFFISGCSSKVLVKKDLEDIKEIKIVRYEFPGYMKLTSATSSKAVAVVTPLLLFGAVGGGIGGAIADNIVKTNMTADGIALQDKFKLPDYSKLVYASFSEKIPKRVPQDWPRFVTDPAIIKEVAKYDKPDGTRDYTREEPPEFNGDALILRSSFVVSHYGGVRADTLGKLINSKGKVLWSKHISYKSKEGNIPSLENLEEDNAKLLRSEINVAVETTVEGLIDNMLNPPKEDETDSGPEKKVEAQNTGSSGKPKDVL